MINRTLASLEDTKALAEWLAPKLRAGDAVCLSGDLGAGKTTFVQFLAHALQCKEEVTSPTFTLLHTYHVTLAGDVACELWHYDLYRIDNMRALAELGLEEAREKLMVVEWPEHCADMHLPSQLTLSFRFEGDVRVVAGTASGDLAARIERERA